MSTNITPIEVTHGSCTFKYSSAKVVVFALPKNTTTRIFPSMVLSTIGTRLSVPASTDNYKGHGMWHKSQLESKNGTILLVQVQISRNGKRWADGSCILHLRHDAPLIEVGARVATDGLATYKTLKAFMGRADILSVEEAKDLGILMRDGYVNTFFEEDELEEVFDIVEHDAGTTMPKIVKVAQPDGTEEGVMVAPTPGRRIRIRR